MALIRILPRNTYDPNRRGFNPLTFWRNRSGGFSLIETDCMDAKGAGWCSHLDEYFAIVGSRNHKKYHVLNSEFVARFEISHPNDICHSELHTENQQITDAMIDYALALTIQDFEICDEGVSRPLAEEDLGIEDYIPAD